MEFFPHGTLSNGESCTGLNSRLFSQMLAVFCVTNIGFNLYLLITVATKELDTFNRFIVSMILAVQFCMMVAVLPPAVQITESIFASRRFLVPLQGRIRGGIHGNLIHKLRVNLFYELLNCRRKAVFTIGPSVRLTKMAILKVREESAALIGGFYTSTHYISISLSLSPVCPSLHCLSPVHHSICAQPTTEQ